MKNNIVLIGMPTSGKSTIGVILAKILGMDFVDTDLLIQNKYKKKLSEIISEKGVMGFVEAEEEVCKNINYENTVIATGGSVVYGEESMKHLGDIGTIIYLKISYEILEVRLHHARQRGVVLKEGQTKKDMYFERVGLYEKYADITISEDNKDIEETIEEIMDTLLN